VTLFKIIGDRLDTLLHASARADAMTAARHRAFIAPRLVGSLMMVAVIPAYLALRGAPSALEVAGFCWLIAPILAAYHLSRTGQYERASAFSLLALAALVLLMAAPTGGIKSFAAVWLILLPVEAEAAGILPSYSNSGTIDRAAESFGVIVGLFYAGAIAFGAQSLSRTSVALLSEEEERYRLLTTNMSDVISRHRPTGAVMFISPVAEQLLGVPPARLLGHGLFDRVHVADRPAYLTALSDAAQTRTERSVEFRVRSDERDGERRPLQTYVWMDMRCRPLDNNAGATAEAGDNGAEVVAVMRDITDRKLHEQALSSARAEAEQAYAAKDRFLATMSHELRTPLNAIIGFSEMIVQEETMMLDAAKRREYAQLINDSGQHLLSVVNGILDISKMEAGRFDLSPELFAPGAALVNCCNILALKARENGIELVVKAASELPDLNGDPRAFKQIVLNLVSNAIKFTERGGTVSVAVQADGARIKLRIADTGIGIAQTNLARLGDPFFQAAETYQRRHEGTGLGLSIVKSLVAMHGGEMHIESELGVGTTIVVALPFEFTPPLPTSNVSKLPSPRPESHPLKVKKRA
jgi:cell cycle sensor histidine kinase DivJ